MEDKRDHPQFKKIQKADQMKVPNAEQIPSLPEEIIEEILSRLPVKSLLKFRCVAKSWCSLISTKKFIKTHVEKSAKDPSFTQHRIILRSCPPRYSLMQCSLHSLLNEPVTDSSAFDDPMYAPVESVQVVGCCNGLICILVDGKYFYLCNPSMKMSKKLPDIDDKLRRGSITKCGFGYDESNDDYKVFGILSKFVITGRRYPTARYRGTRKIYSLNSNLWKRIEGREDDPLMGVGKFVNGRLHWCDMLLSRWIIISFDLTSEVYGMVEQPSYPEGSSFQSVEVLGGCLCMLCYYEGDRTDVWVLKQYGVIESWDKVVTVPCLSGIVDGPLSTPLCIGPNGEILFLYGPTFIIYYPKYNWFWYPQMVNSGIFIEADVYTESLVSLVSDDEQSAEQINNHNAEA